MTMRVNPQYMNPPASNFYGKSGAKVPVYISGM